MKNVEEDILKRFLQDTFSDYEPEPSEQSWENIRKEIQPHQPRIDAGLRQWIMPVVALLLLLSGIFWSENNSGDKKELAINSTKKYLKNETQIFDNQDVESNKLMRLGGGEREEKSEKKDVNKTTSKVESKVLSKVEKSLRVPAFSTPLTERVATQNGQEYAVSTKGFIGIEDKNPVVISTVSGVPNDNYLAVNRTAHSSRLRLPRMNSDSADLWILGLNSEKKSEKSPVIVSVSTDNPTQKVVDNNKENPSSDGNSSPVIVSVSTDNSTQKVIDNNRENPSSDGNSTHIIYKSINSTNHNLINDAVIEEVRHIKPLETLKNKGFVLVKNEINIPQITDIFIKKDAKPLRRPTYMNVSIMPLQTYRILTVNSRNIQNLQTNNLFDSERNGWAFELGITKSIGNKWNFRSNISYLKMRQWAEYQVNTDNISVKNSNSINTGNEYIGQTRIEAKTLQMVGVKADVQRFFKISARNRYFISGGSQLMVEPNEKQTNVFINASAGFQHVVNKDCFLTIEPTASYLLNNINDSKSLIQTNAYNLGLKVGLSFKVK